MDSEKVIGILQNAIHFIPKYPSDLGWIYRGHQDYDWQLIPSAGRSPHFRSADPVRNDEPRSKRNPPRDLGVFNHWTELAEGCTESLPENNFRRLALAQHYGLPTRLLDFTENMMVALYFACEGYFDRDGALFAYFPSCYLDIDVADLYNVPLVASFIVPPFDKRILQQRGRFVYFPDPSRQIVPEPIPDDYSNQGVNTETHNLVKFRIPRESKLAIQRQLRDIGISRKTLFPDLEGLSRDFVVEDHYREAFRTQVG